VRSIRWPSVSSREALSRAHCENRSQGSPLAAISSSVKRSIPFCVFADPLRSRICSTSLAPGEPNAEAGGNSSVILDFGGQKGTNGSTKSVISSTEFKQAQIETIVEGFAFEYVNCVGEDTTSQLTIAVGTNNDKRVSTATGTGWALLIGCDSTVPTMRWNRLGEADAHARVGRASSVLMVS
jgi:hypothetical protein